MVRCSINARSLVRWLGAVAAVLGFQVAHAVEWREGYSYWTTRTGNIVEVEGPGISSGGHTVTGSANGVTVSGSRNIALGGGRSVAVQATKSIPWANLAKGLGYIGGAITTYQAGSAIYDWIRENNARAVECGGPNSNGTYTSCIDGVQWQVDDGSGTTSTSTVYRNGHEPGTKYYGSQDAACRAGIAYQFMVNPNWKAYWENSGWTVTLSNPGGMISGTTCRGRYDMQKGSTSDFRTLNTSITAVAETWCIDSAGNAIVKPIGGQCPSGGWRDANYGPDVEPRLAGNPPSGAGPGTNHGPDIWQGIQSKGGGIPDTGQKPNVSGPPTVPGPSSSTTGPNGVTNISTVYNITYNNNQVTVTETTTKTNPDGSQEVTDKQPEAPPDERSECEKSPGTLGCITVGTPPNEDIPQVEKPVALDIEPVSIGTASCPAPHVIETPFGAASIEYTLACDAFTMLKPLVLGMAAMLAGMIMLGALKQ